MVVIPMCPSVSHVISMQHVGSRLDTVVLYDLKQFRLHIFLRSTQGARHLPTWIPSHYIGRGAMLRPSTVAPGEMLRFREHYKLWLNMAKNVLVKSDRYDSLRSRYQVLRRGNGMHNRFFFARQVHSTLASDTESAFIELCAPATNTLTKQTQSHSIHIHGSKNRNRKHS